MVRVSNNLVGILNLITFLLSVPILGAGIWLAKRAATTDCEKFLEKPVIAIGVFLMIVSLAGLIGACCGVSWLLWLYLVVMLLLIVLLSCFTAFAFVVTNKGAGNVLSNRGYKEYKLGDYSNWLQNRVNGDNAKNWNKIKSCLIDGHVCKGMSSDANVNTTTTTTTTVEVLYAKRLSALQSGCCKPSDTCNFEYVTPTQWNKPGNGTYTNNADCNAWDNDINTLCFNCQSCKAGVLDNLKSDWKTVAAINMFSLAFLIFAYTIGCCAFRNNRESNAYSKRRSSLPLRSS